MFPFAMICYTLYGKLLFGMPTDRPLRTGWQIAWYFIGMFTVGVAEEFLFRGVIAQTLLEHFGTSRAGIWKACLLSGFFFGGAHLTNILSSAPFGVLMQCVFAGSLGVLFAAIYFRTGNLWVLVFLHGAQDAASLLAGGLYGTGEYVHCREQLRFHHAAFRAGLSHPHLLPPPQKRRSGKWASTLAKTSSNRA